MEGCGEVRYLVFHINHGWCNYYTMTSSELHPGNTLYWTCVLGTWEVLRRALTPFWVISRVVGGYISLGHWRRSNFGICQI
jgi:hypothetical protein